eukprot:m.10202 g.10202  ORF g.10202 m.10202 type:complete len:324 (-) comp3716_c0_seq1:131-1102(-)
MIGAVRRAAVAAVSTVSAVSAVGPCVVGRSAATWAPHGLPWTRTTASAWAGQRARAQAHCDNTRGYAQQTHNSGTTATSTSSTPTTVSTTTSTASTSTGASDELVADAVAAWEGPDATGQAPARFGGRATAQDVSLHDLFLARVHLGHEAGTWNPKMQPYIMGKREGTHIINLDHTLPMLRRALAVTTAVAEKGGVILFAGTRKKFSNKVRDAALGCGEYFVHRKWMGGTLTNCMQTLGANRLPDLVILTSLPVNQVALKEAFDCDVPTIALVDTDCDPSMVTYPVPANDDTPESVHLLLDLFSQAVLDGKTKTKKADSQSSA